MSGRFERSSRVNFKDQTDNWHSAEVTCAATYNSEEQSTTLVVIFNAGMPNSALRVVVLSHTPLHQALSQVDDEIAKLCVTLFQAKPDSAYRSSGKDWEFSSDLL